jgi:hypothetical protein
LFSLLFHDFGRRTTHVNALDRGTLSGQILFSSLLLQYLGVIISQLLFLLHVFFLKKLVLRGVNYI